MLTAILFYGLQNAFILLIVSLGFCLTFGVSGVANFAYGGLYLLSGCIAWLTARWLKLPLYFSFPIVITAVGAFGYAFYWIVLRRLRGMALSEVVSTYAAGVAILELVRWAGVVTYEFTLPYVVKGSFLVLGWPLDYQRLFIMIGGVVALGVLYAFTHHTGIGLAFRGIAQNERTAICLGVNPDRIAALSVALGSAFGAFAATLVLPLGIISVNVGYEVLLIALAVGIVGGLESIAGMVLASFVLGYAQTAASFLLKPEWSMLVYLIAIVTVLIVKPSGLLGKLKELEERV